MGLLIDILIIYVCIESKVNKGMDKAPFIQCLRYHVWLRTVTVRYSETMRPSTGYLMDEETSFAFCCRPFFSSRI